MSRNLKVIAVLTVVLVSVAGVTIWYVVSPPAYPPSYADTLPLGQDPSLILPLADDTHIWGIGGYGQVEPDRWHNGFDFGVNDTTIIVAPCDAYVAEVRYFYNGPGAGWQVNVNLRLNAQWRVGLAFEPGSLNDTYGSLQAELVLIQLGQYVKTNQTIGYLLYHSSGGRGTLHLGVSSYDTSLCPYHYFAEPAKSVFLDEFSHLNGSISWDMSNYTWPSS